jgi:hypothetical protein
LAYSACSVSASGLPWPIDQVRFSAWRPEEVAFEVHVTVEQFDVDATGDAVLAAWWRLLSPGGEKMLASGRILGDPAGPVAAERSASGGDVDERLGGRLRPSFVRRSPTAAKAKSGAFGHWPRKRDLWRLCENTSDGRLGRTAAFSFRLLQRPDDVGVQTGLRVRKQGVGLQNAGRLLVRCGR